MQTIPAIRKILVPLDFSETSINAMKNAANMAKTFGASLTLFNVQEPFSEQKLKNEKGTDYDEKAKTKFEEIRNQFSENFSIEVDLFIAHGKIEKELIHFVEENQFDLIVDGVDGLAERNKFFLGSNAYKIANSTKVPVMSVRKNNEVRQIQNILVPIDSSFNTREKIGLSADLAIQFKATIHLLGLMTMDDKSEQSHFKSIFHQVQLFFDKKGVDYIYEIKKAGSLAAEILDYSSKEKIDLAVIMTEQETSLSNLFLGPYAKQIIEKSNIPVIAIPPRVELNMEMARV
jgi:nucleotide-binding universal stress UspA family protein